MFTDNLNINTQVTLLLCANLQESSSDISPLTPTEFDWVLAWLIENDLSLSDLMDDEGGNPVEKIQHKNLNPARLHQLLGRGGTLALAVESMTNNGIWILSRSDDKYPSRLNDRLGRIAPPLLYGSGNQDLLSAGGLAIIGSRDVDEAGANFAKEAAELCARDGIAVISGGARGVDQVAMRSALNEGGNVVGILAAGLARTIVTGDNREPIINGNLTLISPYNPNAGFSVGNAMGRNKYIYALSEWALIVSSDLKKGGTWSGALENLKSGYSVPIFVRHDENIPPGNTALIEKGGIPLMPDELRSVEHFQTYLEEKAKSAGPEKKSTVPNGEIEQLEIF